MREEQIMIRHVIVARRIGQSPESPMAQSDGSEAFDEPEAAAPSPLAISGGGTRAGRLRCVAGLAVLAVTASACASGGGSSQEAGEAEDAGGVINMVMAPDPVWKWLDDNGIKQEIEVFLLRRGGGDADRLIRSLRTSFLF